MWNFKTWYENNKEALNEKRRRSYANDPEYKERVKAANTKSRNVRRVEEGRARQDANLQTTQRLDHGPFRSVVIDGTVYFTIGALASVLNCSRQAIRAWDRAGVFPKASHVTATDVRLYTYERIVEIAKTWALPEESPSGDDRDSRVAPLWRDVRFVGKRTPERTALFRLGVLAKIVSRAFYTLTTLEREGVLPRSPLSIPLEGSGETAGSVRLYTAGMIESVSKAFSRWPDLTDSSNAEKFTAFVMTEWSAQRIFGKSRGAAQLV
jgi:hypothetical protein